jgi:hypothetical protein
MIVIYSGSLYLANERTIQGSFQDSDLAMHTYINDSSGSVLRIVWVWRPESVCMIAYANPDDVVCVDSNGYRYTGKMVENLIFRSSNNDYSLVNY